MHWDVNHLIWISSESAQVDLRQAKSRLIVGGDREREKTTRLETRSIGL